MHETSRNHLKIVTAAMMVRRDDDDDEVADNEDDDDAGAAMYASPCHLHNFAQNHKMVARSISKRA